MSTAKKWLQAVVYICAWFVLAFVITIIDSASWPKAFDNGVISSAFATSIVVMSFFLQGVVLHAFGWIVWGIVTILCIMFAHDILKLMKAREIKMLGSAAIGTVNGWVLVNHLGDKMFIVFYIAVIVVYAVLGYLWIVMTIPKSLNTH
ncbi:hypothetical protein [Candidatus Uabimicrobium amorphum]|uniref:Uncharacterized protein n=1 Tax=Uabimicrobium amorphum TaxID=2596890 RepID=A0A5S9IS65_UABAM|nr:hypothetical protein [Candidatus Uabimicrobium amorphum]BBM86626.1 hypothetical protein UABAM_05012 [Candidatus Uabimicrobium amorphum]